ncbi:MAG: dipeptidase [candidate division Zixibacteria bacterium]|nr:dipeptidase [candidate division Zixibacteria bacterium]
MTPFAYLKKTESKRRKDLFTLLSFPTVSAKSEHKKDIAACAEWLKKHLAETGFKSKIYATKGNPIVFAEYFVGKNLPTVLYYGHYDVQPPEPLNLWKTPPFKPQVRAGYIHARGACDDKGQFFAQLKGLEAVIKTTGSLPVNVKFLIEGEEESHSTNLPPFIRKNKKLLKADIVVISDTAQFDKQHPAVTFGLRGIASVEVFVYGPAMDLHSGGFGGAVGNPVNILCGMVGQLHDKSGKIAIPGFYKDCKPISPWVKKQFKKLPYNEAKYKKAIGIPALHGEKNYTTYEKVTGRPTCDVNGITGGYQGEGAKTIIPSMASCKITMRLVPDMKPDDICDKIEKYLKQIAPKSVRVKVNKHGGAKAVEVPVDGPWLEAAGRAIKIGFGKEPVFIKEGGSIPIVIEFKETLGIDSLLVGFGQNDDNIHSPNERFRVVDFERGCKTAAALPFELAKVRK